MFDLLRSVSRVEDLPDEAVISWHAIGDDLLRPRGQIRAGRQEGQALIERPRFRDTNPHHKPCPSVDGIPLPPIFSGSPDVVVLLPPARRLGRPEPQRGLVDMPDVREAGGEVS